MKQSIFIRFLFIRLGQCRVLSLKHSCDDGTLQNLKKKWDYAQSGKMYPATLVILLEFQNYMENR